MNNLTRRAAQRRLAAGDDETAARPDIPEWSELSRMRAPAVRKLAAKLGIDYTNRVETLSAIHEAR